MIKVDFFICKNKGVDNLRGNPSSYYSQIFKPFAIFCTAWFMSDPVGNPEHRFSQDETHMSFEMFSSHSSAHFV